jgi:hypothetical protein
MVVYARTQPLLHVKYFKSLTSRLGELWTGDVEVVFGEGTETAKSLHVSIPLSYAYKVALELANSNTYVPDELIPYNPVHLYPVLIKLYTYRILSLIDNEHDYRKELEDCEKALNKNNSPIDTLLSKPSVALESVLNNSNTKQIVDQLSQIKTDDFKVLIDKMIKSFNENSTLKDIIQNTLTAAKEIVPPEKTKSSQPPS